MPFLHLGAPSLMLLAGAALPRPTTPRLRLAQIL